MSGFQRPRSGNETSFETFPDISRKLDTILQLLQGSGLLESINTVKTQQRDILGRLDQVSGVEPSTTSSAYQAPNLDARTTLLMNQQWGETQSGFGMGSIMKGWSPGCIGCTEKPAPQTASTYAPQPALTYSAPTPDRDEVERTVSRSDQRVLDLLEEVLSRVSTRRAPQEADLTEALFSINEELGNVKQMISLRPQLSEVSPVRSEMTDLKRSFTQLQQAVSQTDDEEVLNRLDQIRSNLSRYNELLEQIYGSISQLVGQANDNTGMISDLRGTLNEINTLLVQNINHRSGDIQQLIDENDTLRSHLQTLVTSIEGQMGAPLRRTNRH